MPGQTETLRIKIQPGAIPSSVEGLATIGEVKIQHWDQRDRLRRATLTWLSCWGGAIIAIPFPIIHFVLIPTLLLGGPIIASIVYKQKDVVLGGSGNCPHCGKPFAVARTRMQWPLSDLCTECGDEVRIYPSP